jgi:hypothetical protein
MMDLLSPNVLQCRLAREELAYLVRLFGATHLPGLPKDVETIMQVGSGGSLLQATERALLARRLLLVDDDRRLVADQLVASLIQICISPGFTVSIVQTDDDRGYSDLRIFNVAPNVTVLHELPLAGIHELTAITGMPFSLADSVMVSFPLGWSKLRSITLSIAELKQALPGITEYTLRLVDGQLWFSDDMPPDANAVRMERQVTREELIAALDTIGAPIRALSQLQIEPQP